METQFDSSTNLIHCMTTYIQVVTTAVHEAISNESSYTLLVPVLIKLARLNVITYSRARNDACARINNTFR